MATGRKILVNGLIIVILLVSAYVLFIRDTGDGQEGSGAGDDPGSGASGVNGTGAVDPGCEGLTGCELYSCRFTGCWCVETEGDPVLYLSGRKVTSPQEARFVIDEYFVKRESELDVYYDSADLGYGWFNLFYGEAGENVYTVGPDGAVYLTECGV